jgi:hypothetical protein
MKKVLRQLAPLVEREPHSTLGLAAALRDPSPLKVKVLTAGPRDRSSCVLVRDAVGYWSGYPVLADPADAPELARAIDRSPAIRLLGWSEMVHPLRAHLERPQEVPLVSEMTAVPFQTVDDFGAPDDTTRMANPFDVDDLVDLFEGYEVSLARTRASLRRILDDAARRMWIVVSLDGERIVGAMMASGFTPQYTVWGHMTVAPEHRGEGRSWAMVIRVGTIHLGTGLGFMGATADTNPMKTPPTTPDEIEAGDYMSVGLGLPARVPGEKELRRAAWQLDRKVRRSRPQRDGTFSRREAGLTNLGDQPA